jgi:type IV secretion system protein VirB1
MDFMALAQQCAPDVHPQTMAAIVRTESGFNPLALGINHKGESAPIRQPKTKDEAVAAAKRLIGAGYNIDLGLGQINLTNLSALGLTVEDAFDPCKNLTASATILTNNYKRAQPGAANAQGALTKALSAYNTGDFLRGLVNGYVAKVQASSQRIENPGYVVPKIAPPSGAPAPERMVISVPSEPPPASPLVLTATDLRHGASAMPNQAPSPPATDPALVFGSQPAGGDQEADQTLVF